MSGLMRRSFFIMDNLKQSLLFCINKNPVLKLLRFGKITNYKSLSWGLFAADGIPLFKLNHFAYLERNGRICF